MSFLFCFPSLSKFALMMFIAQDFHYWVIPSERGRHCEREASRRNFQYNIFHVFSVSSTYSTDSCLRNDCDREIRAYSLPVKGVMKQLMTKLPSEVTSYFPYATVRPIQDQFIKTVFDTVEAQHSILIEGSNGLGKTISALSACLPTAVELDLKILYVARTHRQHDRVIEELKAICEKRQVSGVSLRGRYDMCPNQFAARHTFDARSLMDVCELLKTKDRCPFYRNIEEETDNFLEAKAEITSHPHKATDIQKVCKKMKLCPYELVKSVLPEVRVVALSYLYVFDPIIRASFLRNIESTFHKVILIVDEAHNLPDTAIGVSSSGLSLFVLRQAQIEARKFQHSGIENCAKLLQ